MTASATAFVEAPSPNLLEVLASRRAQARPESDAYIGGVAPQGTMMFWLARAAKELREAAGRKQVHIAASMSKDQSTVYRFEQGGSGAAGPRYLRRRLRGRPRYQAFSDLASSA